MQELRGRHFCVSFAAPADIQRAHDWGQSVMLDNGAFSAWTAGRSTDWPGYYAWCDRWLPRFPTTWAVVPDVITGSEELQDELIQQWPHGFRGAPVWHMHESLDRLLRLSQEWPRICIGSSAEYARVLSPKWVTRMDAAWDFLSTGHRYWPWVHMLRGMQLCAKGHWPFASLDSTDIGRNHNRPQNTPRGMADRWDPLQGLPSKFYPSLK